MHSSPCLGSSISHQPSTHVDNSLALSHPMPLKMIYSGRKRGKENESAVLLFLLILFSVISFSIHSQYSLTSGSYLLSSFSQPTPFWFQPSSLSDAIRSSVTFLFLNLRDVFQSSCCLICLRHLTLWPLKIVYSLCFHGTALLWYSSSLTGYFSFTVSSSSA